MLGAEGGLESWPDPRSPSVRPRPGQPVCPHPLVPGGTLSTPLPLHVHLHGHCCSFVAPGSPQLLAPERAGSRTLARSRGHSALPGAGCTWGGNFRGSQVKAPCGGRLGRRVISGAESHLADDAGEPPADDGDTNLGSPPAPGGPSTALGTPPQTPGMGIFNKLPWLQ